MRSDYGTHYAGYLKVHMRNVYKVHNSGYLKVHMRTHYDAQPNTT